MSDINNESLHPLDVNIVNNGKIKTATVSQEQVWHYEAVLYDATQVDDWQNLRGSILGILEGKGQNRWELVSAPEIKPGQRHLLIFKKPQEYWD